MSLFKQGSQMNRALWRELPTPRDTSVSQISQPITPETHRARNSPPAIFPASRVEQACGPNTCKAAF